MKFVSVPQQVEAVRFVWPVPEGQQVPDGVEVYMYSPESAKVELGLAQANTFYFAAMLVGFNEYIEVEPGDWIVTWPDGRKEAFSHEMFTARFKQEIANDQEIQSQ